MPVSNNNNNVLVAIIAIMALVIWVMWFYLWKMSSGWSTAVKYEKLTMQVITDTRDTSVPVDMILDELKELPSISKASIVEKDFSEAWVSEYLLENNITALPAFIFSTSNFDTTLDPKMSPDWIPMAPLTTYLSPLPGWDFILPIGATYNPFIERSDRWFLLLEEWVLEEIKEWSYINWDKDAEITWLEFSDFGCAFCVKMHAEDKTPQKVMENFGDKVNTIFMHMPFRNMEVAQAVECIGDLGGEDLFNEVIKKWFDAKITTKAQALELAWSKVSESDFNTCISENRVENRINFHMAIGQSVFNVTGTPNNVLINNKTWEYEILAWAFPYDSFAELINRLTLD